MFHNTPALAGCPRAGRCSGILGLRRDLRNTISALIPTSRLLAGLTARAYNYMVSEAHKFVVGKTAFCEFPNLMQKCSASLREPSSDGYTKYILTS